MDEVRRTTPELQALTGLFFRSIDQLGEFEEVHAGQLPTVYRTLLDHDQHMTVTVEAHHGCPVGLQVLDTNVADTHYARKIVLSRQSDGEVVQFGIVRLNVDYLGPQIRKRIEDQQIPLGRILIEHDILRTVRLLSLWRVEPGESLSKLFQLNAPTTTYGRTALIYCNAVPAVELLEIVTPA